MTDRYLPTWDFPAYVFTPGENPHPKKEGGHMFGEAEPISPQINLKAPKSSDHLLYALDLYNYGYYWESHVYFEALWNAHHRIGPVADFLKGLIKLGAAGVKINLGQISSAKDHFLRAQELINSVKDTEGDQLLGFDLQEILKQIKITLDSNLSRQNAKPLVIRFII